MRATILKLWAKVANFFAPYECYKESMGYTCRHQMHGNVPECGDWSKVRGYNHAAR